MKRFGMILLAAAALYGCAKQPDTELVVSVPAEVEEALTARLSTDTRVGFDDGRGFFSWTEGDAIAIHCSAGYNGNNVEVIAAGYKTPALTIDATDPAIAHFHMIHSSGQKRDGFALYPASAFNLDGDGSTLVVTLPATYEIAPTGMGTNSPTPMVAVNDPTESQIYFRHIGGLLRITLNDVSPATASITVNLGKRLTGQFTVQDAGTPVPYIATDDAADEITFLLTEELTDYTSGIVLNVPVPTGTYSMLKVTAKNAAGDIVYSYQDKTSRFFEPGRGRRVETSISSIATPLCLEALEVGAVIINNPIGLTIEYSRDNETWTPTSDASIYLVVNEGDCIYLRGNNAKYSKTTSLEGDLWTGTTISSDGECYLYGNIMSLIDADDFVNCKTLTESFALSALFISSTDLKMHPEKSLELPATTLTPGCYFAMFYDSRITSAPSLPASVVPHAAYAYMFSLCSELEEAPEINVEQIGDQGCWGMFTYCTGLTSIPDMKCGDVGTFGLANAFFGCTSLVNAPAIECGAVGYYGMSEMFAGSGIVHASTFKASELGNYSCNELFGSCAYLQDMVSIEVDQAKDHSFSNAFRNCTSLTTAPAFNVSSVGEEACRYMFYGCTSLTAAPLLTPTTLGRSCYFEMFNGCTSLTTVPDLPATTLARNCYSFMFDGCTSLTSAPGLPATSLAEDCYFNMFKGCTSLTTAPDLPALELVEGCYQSMFYGCTNLNYVKALFLTNPEYRFTSGWLEGVSTTGTFVKNAAATWDVSGPSGIPDGWTVETVTL